MGKTFCVGLFFAFFSSERVGKDTIIVYHSLTGVSSHGMVLPCAVEAQTLILTQVKVCAVWGRCSLSPLFRRVWLIAQFACVKQGRAPAFL